MKNYLLYVSLFVFSPSIKAMSKTAQVAQAQQERLKSLQQKLLDALFERRYEEVSQLFEDNEDLKSGPVFIGCLDQGVILGHHMKNKTFGLAYFLYKAAHEASHTRLIQILGTAKQIYYAYMAASNHNDADMCAVIEAHPLFEDQSKEYSKLVLRHDLRLFYFAGKTQTDIVEWLHLRQLKFS